MAKASVLEPEADDQEEQATILDVPAPHEWEKRCPEVPILLDDLEKTKRALKLLAGGTEANLGREYSEAQHYLHHLEDTLRREISRQLVNASYPELTETG